jgi:thiol-disulfide isomerase/thioredoxin
MALLAVPPDTAVVETLAPRTGQDVLETLQALRITDLSGRRWAADDLRGRVVLIDFWATWCAPCLADMPGLKTLYAKHSRDAFEILGVSLDVSSRQSFVSWLNRNRIEWPQTLERRGYGADLARLFGVDRLPRTIVLGRDGSIEAVDVRGEQLVSLIDLLVSGPSRTATVSMRRQ